MYLINNKALVVRSSSVIYFFKREFDDATGEKRWELYHELQHKGLIFHIKGNVRM
jgi:hypothetical protein